jgi:hypothetical protein
MEYKIGDRVSIKKTSGWEFNGIIKGIDEKNQSYKILMLDRNLDPLPDNNIYYVNENDYKSIGNTIEYEPNYYKIILREKRLKGLLGNNSL